MTLDMDPHSRAVSASHVLTIHGDRDSTIPVEDAYTFHERIRVRACTTFLAHCCSNQEHLRSVFSSPLQGCECMVHAVGVSAAGIALNLPGLQHAAVMAVA